MFYRGVEEDMVQKIRWDKIAVFWIINSFGHDIRSKKKKKKLKFCVGEWHDKNILH